MKSKRKQFLIFILIVMSLFLFAACKAETPPPASSGSPAEAAVVEEQPAAPAPAEAKIEETQKTAEPTPKVIEEPSKETNNDKTSLQIEGSGIEKAISLSLDELKAMKGTYFEDDFFSLNSYGTKEYFSFKGVKLSAILEKAGLKKNAAAVKFIASDGYELEITIGQALKEDYIDEQNPDKRYPVIIAWNENGQDYDVSKGAPFRLVIGQKEPGDINKPQWVQNIAKIIVN